MTVLDSVWKSDYNGANVFVCIFDVNSATKGGGGGGGGNCMSNVLEYYQSYLCKHTLTEVSNTVPKPN